MNAERRRELPPIAQDALARFLRYDPLGFEAFSGGTYADRHRVEYGHLLGPGCCARASNRCAGCDVVLPGAAKRAGFTYCSARCRKEHNE